MRTPEQIAEECIAQMLDCSESPEDSKQIVVHAINEAIEQVKDKNQAFNEEIARDFESVLDPIPGGHTGSWLNRVKALRDERDQLKAERERTCEWVVKAHRWVAPSGKQEEMRCLVSACCPSRFRAGVHDVGGLEYCPFCGGKIAVKTPRTGCDFKSTSSRVCERGTHGCQVKHGGK